MAERKAAADARFAQLEIRRRIYHFPGSGDRSAWVSQGRLRSVEDTVPGDIEMFPSMLARLFSCQNTGKLVLELRV
jgi:NADPH-dependent curcumin reductase CurA